MWALIKLGLGFLPTVLGWFGIGSKDERDVERSAGEKLGRQETENANAQSGIREVETAIAARDASGAAIADNPARLRDGSDPAARDYKPGPD